MTLLNAKHVEREIERERERQRERRLIKQHERSEILLYLVFPISASIPLLPGLFLAFAVYLALHMR